MVLPLPPPRSSTSSRPRLNLSGMCGTAGRVMRVGRVPLKRGEKAPGPRNLSPALPAIPVLHPGLEHLRLLPCRGASRSATGASQVSSGHTGHNLQGRVVLLGHRREGGQRDQAQKTNPSPSSPWAAPEHFSFLFVFILRVCLLVSLDPGTVPRAPSHFSRLPLGGWAEDGQSASRHPEPVPEEGSEDELPPQVHKVRTPGPKNNWQK